MATVLQPESFRGGCSFGTGLARFSHRHLWHRNPPRRAAQAPPGSAQSAGLTPRTRIAARHGGRLLNSSALTRCLERQATQGPWVCPPRLPGPGSSVTPTALADLGDGDNNHLLCLDTADTPVSVSFPGGIFTDPNDDLNPATSVAIRPGQS